MLLGLRYDGLREPHQPDVARAVAQVEHVAGLDERVKNLFERDEKMAKVAAKMEGKQWEELRQAVKEAKAAGVSDATLAEVR